eukprot:10414443-Prorocentrum_lima.AAC.1
MLLKRSQAMDGSWTHKGCTCRPGLGTLSRMARFLLFFLAWLTFLAQPASPQSDGARRHENTAFGDPRAR